MITLSQAAIGLGVAAKIEAGEQQTTQLPPGLYQPDAEHLSHALMNDGRFHPIPEGCPTDYIRTSSEPFHPQFFSEDEFTVTHRIVELLLGEVSQPGADGREIVSQEVAQWIDLRVSSAAGVREAALHMNSLPRALAAAYFGLHHVNEIETSDPEKICREGLTWIASAAQSRQAQDFLSLSTEQQIAILDSISDGRADKENENPGTRFFAFLKGEVIRSFYTSRAGLKELDFKGNAFYARSPGCQTK